MQAVGCYTNFMARAQPPADLFEPDPVIEAYKRHVDRSLLRENLKRSVEQRLSNLIELQRLAEEARTAEKKRSDASR